jgi:predicted RNase H-like HicB family nuclease
MSTKAQTSKCSTPRREHMKLTTVFWEVAGGYIGFVEELPGANTQGRTLAEARENLQEAIDLVLQANRELAEEILAQQKLTSNDVIREQLLFAAV